MSDRYVTLLGAEQVQSAASTMARAAEDMNRAASTISSALERHQRFLENWLQQIEDIRSGIL